MSIIRLPIDTKSLYFNILNDNETGHTATVATPLKQGGSIRPELAKVYEIPETINVMSRESLVSELLNKSRAKARICRVLTFDRIAVNWEVLEVPSSFCIYIREETDPTNVHFGRLKLHYPQSLHFSDETIAIDNKRIVTAVSAQLHDYAFIVEAFEYDTQTGVLNFDAVIVGENGIPYSKVFVNRRGVGNKFSATFSEMADAYDSEILSLREKMGYNNVGPDSFNEIYCSNNNKACELAIKHLEDLGAINIRFLSYEYPYSLFDIQYSLNGKKRFIIVKQTATKSIYFCLPISQIQFAQSFKNLFELWFFYDIIGEPVLVKYSSDDLNGLTKAISSITYTDKGERE